jgi:hypothetical protein
VPGNKPRRKQQPKRATHEQVYQQRSAIEQLLEQRNAMVVEILRLRGILDATRISYTLPDGPQGQAEARSAFEQEAEQETAEASDADARNHQAQKSECQAGSIHKEVTAGQPWLRDYTVQDARP